MFSIKESLKFGWEKFKNNLNISLAATLLSLALGSVGEIFDNDGVGTFIFILAIAVVSAIVRIGYMKIFLKMADGQSVKFGEIFEEYRLFWRYVGVSILTALAVIGGFILLVIPGIIWAIKYSFSQLILIDTNGRPVASMKESGAITKGHKWKLLGFYLVLMLVNLLGLIALGVGLLVTIPVSMFALIHVYRALSRANAGLTNPEQTGLTQISTGI